MTYAIFEIFSVFTLSAIFLMLRRTKERGNQLGCNELVSHEINQ
jgi:hypothetical protein